MVNAGRILIMPKGDWNALTTYDMLDLVSYNGTAYLARQTNVGQNPSTDTSQTYWQPFGSASAIATTSAPGLVMPDGDTITVDGSGLIEVNIDNDTLIYDSVNGYIKANITSALANLTDVNVTSAQNGQALIYDNTSQKWENTTLYGDGIALSSSDATTITSKIGTLSGNVSTLQGNVSTLQGNVSALQAPTFTQASTRTNVNSGDNYTTLWGKVKKWFSDIDTKDAADIGKIEAFMRTTAPTGYLKCDGTTYYIADYPLLTNMFLAEFGSKNFFGGNGTTTFAVPDLRGEFLRGTGTNSHTNCGSGANVGTHQQPSVHRFIRTDKYGTWGGSYLSSVDTDSYPQSVVDPDSYVTSGVTETGYVKFKMDGRATETSSSVFGTSRPTNTSVLYCIRAY